MAQTEEYTQSFQCKECLGINQKMTPSFVHLCVLGSSFIHFHSHMKNIWPQGFEQEKQRLLPSNQYQQADFIIFFLALISIMPEKLLPCNFLPHHKNSSVLQQKLSASRYLFSRYDCTSGADTLVQQKVRVQTDQDSLDLLTLVLLQIYITEENYYSQFKLLDNTLVCQPSEHKTKWK